MNWGNKERARLVSAAAVIPALRVVGTIIGLKASVAGLASFLSNPTTQSLDRRKYCQARRRERPTVFSG